MLALPLVLLLLRRLPLLQPLRLDGLKDPPCQALAKAACRNRYHTALRLLCFPDDVQSTAHKGLQPIKK